MRNTLSVRTSSRTFKAVLGASLAGALLVSVVPSASAATGSVGGTCAKVGAKAKVGKTNVICKSVAGKKIWTDTKVYKVSISANAVIGGKNTATANWIINYVVPQFELSNAEKGKQVEVSFRPSGIDDNQFKTQLALDLASKRGPDVMALDGFWVSEFAEAGYIKPLDSLVSAKAVNAWEGWKQIPASIQGVMSYGGKRYGIPQGTDARIIYFNKKLFADAGLPTNWQPKSWAELLSAAKTIKTKTPSVLPLQVNAGDGMGEATAMQGFLNLLGGAGSLIYDTKTKKWTGNTKSVRDMLGFYDSVYNKDKVGNSDWQLLAGENGRNQSFKAFAEGKLAMMIEGDYFWRSVINPESGNFKMADRNTNVGFANIPAQTPKSGVNGQSFMTMSGGSGYALNPNSANKSVAWELLKFINGKGPISAAMAIGGAVRISQRSDVNSVVLKSDPCLKFVFEKAIPNTFFRPASVNYNAVSVLLQKATTSIVQGKSVAETAAAYESALKDLVGAANVASN
jgi:multiple sugar transport system substrate-binding protein